MLSHLLFKQCVEYWFFLTQWTTFVSPIQLSISKTRSVLWLKLCPLTFRGHDRHTQHDDVLQHDDQRGEHKNRKKNNNGKLKQRKFTITLTYRQNRERISIRWCVVLRVFSNNCFGCDHHFIWCSVSRPADLTSRRKDNNVAKSLENRVRKISIYVDYHRFVLT